MLQIIIEPNEKYTLGEMGQMAVEGGAAWIILRCNGMSDNQIKEETSDLISLCRESGTILTIENHYKLAESLGIHGVFATDKTLQAQFLRNTMGPEAMIGMLVSTATQAYHLESADIDYAAVDNRETGLDILSDLRGKSNMYPIVLCGDFGIEDLPAIVADGFSGICTGKTAFESKDPAEYISNMLSTLSKQ